MKSRVRITCWNSLKARSSIKVCEERLACKGRKPSSSFYCEDCGSHQCDLCEALLHEDIRMSSHTRGPIVDTPQDLLCDGGCEERNFADVSCSQCDAKFCYPCDYRIHSKESKKTHIRTKFSSETDDFVSCEEIPETNYRIANDSAMLSPSSCVESLPDLFATVCKSNVKDRKPNQSSFLLINENEELQAKNEVEFTNCLQCKSGKLLKVVSIFGNTGDGKSHTFNNTFYGGTEVFRTSELQSSCTIGVWAALCADLDVITIDTEGFLGQSLNPNSRARMLLKVLAISDVVIYRTRAERLHNDMFTFLGDASLAYSKHFAQELEDVSSRGSIEGPLSMLGPAVIIFHETVHTNVLSNDAEILLRKRFHELNLKLDSFSSLKYIGIKTITPPTDFGPLRHLVEQHIRNCAVRTPRSPDVIYKVLKALNDKFSGSLDKAVPSTFPDQYFTCHSCCLSCKCRCVNSMNHMKNGKAHSSLTDCIYQYQYENRVFLCKVCYERGDRIIVSPKTVESNDSSWIGLAKYAWSGYLMECSKCGVIYRSRQFWYGNKNPWDTCVRTEICHVWPDESEDSQANQYTAQCILDNLSSVSEVVSQFSAKPKKLLSSWVADQIAPSYWVPNSMIIHCGLCKSEFEELDTKHHCRICGGGFCESCSTKKILVPGWGSSPVRVCNMCYENGNSESGIADHSSEVTARKIGEVVHSTLGSVASAVNYPIGFIKDTARPSYWVPDSVITHCFICKNQFSPKVALHHCRSCGEGVCDPCSTERRAVPSRGWIHAVRVCNSCKKEETL